mgnify:CR=1 FL=1
MVSEEKKLFKSLQERLDEQRIKRQQEQLADRDEIIRYEAGFALRRGNEGEADR